MLHARTLTHVRAGQSAAREVDLSVERLFYYAAYADKFGGTIQAKMPARRPARARPQPPDRLGR